MGDRNISRKLKGKVLNSCITPAYGLETMVITEKLEVCENNPVRRIARVKRIDKRRMEELSGVAGVRESLTKKLVMSRLMWAGHVERMEGVRVTKRADALRVDGGIRRGRPRLRWEDSMKGDLGGVGGEWTMRARDGGVETGGGDGSETGLVMKKKGKQNSTTGIGASLNPDYRDKNESNM